MRKFEPVTFGVDIQDATTELQDSIQIRNTITFFIKTNVTIYTGPSPP